MAAARDPNAANLTIEEIEANPNVCFVIKRSKNKNVRHDRLCVVCSNGMGS
jgi:hypothetical protein